MSDGIGQLLQRERRDWAANAACADAPTSAFYPEQLNGDRYITAVARAKAICRSCPVRTECLAYAERNNEPAGVWGGLTIKERRRARRLHNLLNRTA